jgi:hypothetical protein
MTEGVAVVRLPQIVDQALGRIATARIGIGPRVIIVPKRGLASKEGLSATGKFKTWIADCI